MYNTDSVSINLQVIYETKTVAVQKKRTMETKMHKTFRNLLGKVQ